MFDFYKVTEHENIADRSTRLYKVDDNTVYVRPIDQNVMLVDTVTKNVF